MRKTFKTTRKGRSGNGDKKTGKQTTIENGYRNHVEKKSPSVVTVMTFCGVQGYCVCVVEQ